MMIHLRPRILVAIGGVALAMLASAVPAAAGDELSAARAGTARYHDISVAKADGYRPLTDANGVACIDNPGVGAMGVHYVKGSLVADPAEHASTPEAVIYEPDANGQMRLVAVEYVVLQSAWANAGNLSPPSLFGQTFELVSSPNRYGLPPFYELHAWIWKNNPSGMFSDWNPTVSCQ